eukprot:5270581-Amphidinium_carterae.1
MAELVVLLFLEFQRPWSEIIGATDASSEACGACIAAGDPHSVAKAGRWSEKWRFKRLPPNERKPRRHALEGQSELQPWAACPELEFSKWSY